MYEVTCKDYGHHGKVQRKEQPTTCPKCGKRNIEVKRGLTPPRH